MDHNAISRERQLQLISSITAMKHSRGTPDGTKVYILGLLWLFGFATLDIWLTATEPHMLFMYINHLT